MGHSVASNVMSYSRTIDPAQSVGHNKVPLVFHSVRGGVVMVMSTLAVFAVTMRVCNPQVHTVVPIKKLIVQFLENSKNN